MAPFSIDFSLGRTDRSSSRNALASLALIQQTIAVMPSVLISLLAI